MRLRLIGASPRKQPKGKAPKAAKGKIADKAKPAAGLKGKKVDSSKKR